jgi:PelA/Pel-15E family pectate lyase
MPSTRWNSPRSPDPVQLCLPARFILRLAATLIASSLWSAAFSTSLINKDDAWFKSGDGKSTTRNILSWQSENGSWPKNQDTASKPFKGDREKLKGTFDNGATTDELRFLAKAIDATGDKNCEEAFLAGFDCILKSQYPNGGFPQYYPLSEHYHRHITFNDNCMVRLLEFLRETTTDKTYAFLDLRRRTAAARAFDRGIDCIVKCQIIVDGKPTVWCAQHDEVTLAPADARAYELKSLSGSESAGILCLLMSLEKPSRDVVRCVNAGAAWFEAVKIEGLRFERADGKRNLIKDTSAPPLWARFYDIESGRPFFCDRDGVKKFKLDEIGEERRNGYAWYGNWGSQVAKAHSRWRYR